MYAEIGLWRADIALYDGPTPKAVIELKIFDENGDADAIQHDLHKAAIASLPINSFVGVMVCETAKSRLEDRLASLENALSRPYPPAKAEAKSRTLRCGPIYEEQGWTWCFAAAARLDPADSRNSEVGAVSGDLVPKSEQMERPGNDLQRTLKELSILLDTAQDLIRHQGRSALDSD